MVQPCWLIVGIVLHSSEAWCPGFQAFLVSQADIMAQSQSPVRRLVGTTVSFLFNRLPAAIEAVVVKDTTFAGVPYDVRTAATSSAFAASAPPRPESAAAAMMMCPRVGSAVRSCERIELNRCAWRSGERPTTACCSHQGQQHWLKHRRRRT